MNNEENIIPEAGNLYSALRNSGYSNIAAIGDLIDNSLDAGAKTIRIDIAEDLKQIFLSDDGVGMSFKTLNQALKLGGRKTHDNINDLGKYGLGLITASISMGTRLRIITKKDGIVNTGIFDIEDIYNSNKFVALFREANEREIQSFDFRTNNAKSGTVLSIENCDKIQYENRADFIEKLRDYIKSAFWAFLSDGREILVNDMKVHSDDPLYRFDNRTQIRLDKTVDVFMGDGKKEKLEIFVVLLPDFGKKLNREMHINIETQGFYILRNNREIASAVEIADVYKKHNDFNRLRIKINFGPGLDEEMGVNYTKHNISPNKRMIGILKRELEEEIRKIRREIKEAQQGGQGPEGPKKGEPKNPFVDVKPGVQQPASTGAEPANAGEVSNNLKEISIKTRFQGEKDDLISFSVSGDNASVWYNGVNKFYQRNIAEKDNGSELKGYLDAVLKSFLEASIKNNVPVETIGKIVKDVSLALENSEV